MYIISYLKMQNGTCPLLHDGSKSKEFENLERPTSSTPMSVD